jgi:hyperosmotically inducible periplasmic protein
MKIMKRNYVAALIAAASMTVAAGNALADDVKSDQPVKDSYITTKVKAELAKDKGTKAHEIHVTTKNGIVMLEGTVNSEAEKELATQDARKIKGVVDVKNGLTVQQ